MEKMTVGRAMAKYLEAAGVEYALGLSGHGNFALDDAFVHETNITSMVVRREDHAVHIAEGYWRIKREGPPIVAVTTVGPGNTNAVPAIANAFFDSIPVLVLAGGGPTQWYGRGGLEEIYRNRPEGWCDIAAPICKGSWAIHRPEVALEYLARGLKLATSGRPGPVVLWSAFDVQHALIEVGSFDSKPWLENISGNPRPDGASMEKAAKLIRGAKRPIILAGGGVLSARASGALKSLAEQYNLPVMTTYMGKGALPENHPLTLGVAGLCGTGAARDAASNCDVLVAFGCRFNDFHTISWSLYKIPDETKLIHVDIDDEEIGRCYPTEVGMVGDAKNAMEDLNSALKGMKPLDKNGEWWKAIAGWKKDFEKVYAEWVGKSMEPPHYAPLFASASRIINERDPEASVMCDTGNTQSFAPVFFKALSQHTSTHGQFCLMGFSVPAAIGAKMANPDHLSVSLTGDGCFFMTSAAIATAVQYNIPVIWIVLNNQSLLMEEEFQILFYGRQAFSTYEKEPLDLKKKGKKNVPSKGLWNPDIAGLAKAYGAEGLKANTLPEFEKALKRAIDSNAPTVIDVAVNRGTKGYYAGQLSFPSKFVERGLQKPYLPPFNAEILK